MKRLRCLLVVEALDGAGLGADHGHLGDVVGGAAVEEGPREGRSLVVVLRDVVLPRRSRGRHGEARVEGACNCYCCCRGRWTGTEEKRTEVV